MKCMGKKTSFCCHYGDVSYTREVSANPGGDDSGLPGLPRASQVKHGVAPGAKRQKKIHEWFDGDRNNNDEGQLPISHREALVPCLLLRAMRRVLHIVDQYRGRKMLQSDATKHLVLRHST